MELIVNPSLYFETERNVENEVNLIPKIKGENRKKFTIAKSDHPNLFRLLGELSQTDFNLLDVEKDINEIERELLFEYEVLIEK